MADNRIDILFSEIETIRNEAFDFGEAKSLAAPKVRVVAEGDSWFRYFPANDVLVLLGKQLWQGRQYDIEHRAQAGDTLNDMVYGRDMVETFQLLEKHRPQVFLFSGGGNDIAGSELYVMLFHKRAVDMHVGEPCINRKILEGLVGEVFKLAYLDMIDLVRRKAEQIGLPHLPIVVHGYDYAIPDGRGWGGGAGPLPGPWLDPNFTRKGYSRANEAQLRRDLVRELIDAFNGMLQQVAQERPDIHYVNLRGMLADKEWANELHPTKEGFAKVTAKIEAAIRIAVP